MCFLMCYIDVPSTKNAINSIAIPIGSILFLSRYLSMSKRLLKKESLFMAHSVALFDVINAGCIKTKLIYVG